MERNLLALLLTGFIICDFFYGHVDAAMKRGKGKVSRMVEDIENSSTANGKLSFANKVIIVTGAGSGIGAHAAFHLAKKGAKVSIVDRDEKGLNEVGEQIKKGGASTPLVIVADVAKDAQRIIDETIKHFGKLNILINNAGIAMAHNAENVKMTDYDLIMNVNVRGVVELIKFAIPHLKKTKGNILNVSSVAAVRCASNLYVYSMSKAALNQLTKCAARDLGPSGIRVNVLAPGVIRTPIYERAFGSSKVAEQFFEKRSKQHPIGRVGEVTDTSAAIEYLVGDSAGFVTGSILTIDGGESVAGEII